NITGILLTFCRQIVNLHFCTISAMLHCNLQYCNITAILRQSSVLYGFNMKKNCAN
ncbi:hypothetical protein ALC57_13124, partial [Trachymyrmex cornetzi]